MDETLFNEMFKKFQNAGQNALIMNHYELADYMFKEHKYKKSISQWKEFLLTPKIQEYIQAEFAIISESNMRKVIASVNEDEKSVGKAQTINALLTAAEKTTNKRDGNTIIYSYILPNEQQMKATNTEVIKRDPFKKDKEN